MKTFEYKNIPINDSNSCELTELGWQGWELVQVFPRQLLKYTGEFNYFRAILKREITQ